MSTPPAKTARRADLDWIRVGAFGLLILFHVALVYAPWDWHVHSRHTFAWLAEAILATGPWRLTLLFLVSGAALRFMARRLTPGAMAKARMERLLPPLLFGILFLVPPQAWLESVDKGTWDQGLLAWWLHQFSPAEILRGIPVNHIWFVLYITVYTFAAAALMCFPRALAWFEALIGGRLHGWKLIFLPIVYLALARILLFPWFGLTNHLPVDWYNHAISLGAFLFGFAIALKDEVWADFERWRVPALIMALVSLALLMWMTAHPGGRAFWAIPKYVVYAVNQWTAIAAILGYGSRYLRNTDGPALRYVTDAVFPCYLAHQTILVIAIFVLKGLNQPAWIEAPWLVGITLGGSLLTYEIVRRLGPIRPLWGLRRHPANRPPAPKSDASSEPARVA
ncbi:acyltransferase family protein [Caulobacter mirabilis]|uniref:acyltransferase family protein n=1 Tax=Caulobacter mirabilis TaxID=69666 RepID=UPI001559E3CE|nr:acyltransferase family protein [Caulobacter mirabilis]